MHALVYRGKRDIRFESFDDPKPVDAGGAIVRVECAGICGSDLHIFEGHGFTPETGYCVGHEAVGEVMEVGSRVTRFRAGDRVMISAAVGCGSCRPCLAGRVDICDGKAARVFGLGPDLQGCQAEAVAVPAADTTLAAIPEGVSAAEAVMLTDNLPTGYFGAKRAQVGPGKTVAVVGLGPVGLMAVDSSFALGAAQVFAIDRVPERRALAASMGATPVEGEDPVAEVLEATSGEGVNSVIEAVGADATVEMAIQLAGRDACVSVVGVSQTMQLTFPMALAFVKGLTFHTGLCSVPEFWPELVPLVQSGRIKPGRVITTEVSLSEGADAYRRFADREAGVVKVVLAP